jgi:hypothetical protein
MLNEKRGGWGEGGMGIAVNLRNLKIDYIEDQEW